MTNMDEIVKIELDQRVCFRIFANDDGSFDFDIDAPDILSSVNLNKAHVKLITDALNKHLCKMLTGQE